MALQRGRMGADERAYYLANKDTSSVADMAAKYNRSEKAVQKALDNLTTVGATVDAPVAPAAEDEKKKPVVHSPAGNVLERKNFLHGGTKGIAIATPQSGEAGDLSLQNKPGNKYSDSIHRMF